MPKPVPAPRRRLSSLLHGTAVLVTTAILVATEVKVPPHKGD
ncbi:hypothetical protein BJ973_005889 [Actinoplanes tereljensis]|nr:hypothetical protein [Actinoplanes tereljensis]